MTHWAGVPVEHPTSTEEVASILRGAHAAGKRVGIGDGALVGPAGAESPDLALSLRGLDQVGIYEPADLTGEFGSGIAGKALRERTGANGQWLPLDPDGWADATLGGLVALGRGGLVEPLYGGPRDLVLGLTLVTGDGRVLELGGRVVKNVAGFDLVRLAVGSRGTLGVITRVAVRFFPLPEADRRLEVRGASIADLGSAEGVVQASMLPLAGAVLRAGGGSDPTLAVRLQGNREPVAAQEAELMTTLGPDRVSAGPWAVEGTSRGGAGADPGAPGQEGTILQVRTRPSRLGEARARLLDTLGSWTPETESYLLTGRLTARLGPMDDPASLAGALRSLREQVAALGGSLVLDRAPGEVMAEVGAMGTPGRSGAIMARLTEQFDPGGTLLPGPFSLEHA